MLSIDLNCSSNITYRQVSDSKRLRKAFLSEGYVSPKSQTNIKILIVKHHNEVEQSIIPELQVKKGENSQLLLMKLQRLETGYI